MCGGEGMRGKVLRRMRTGVRSAGTEREDVLGDP